MSSLCISRIPRWLSILLLVLLTASVYANSFPGAFLLDDVQIVRTNPLVADADLATLFTTDYFGAGHNTGLFRPLTILSFAANRWLLGPEPWSFHLINVALHVLATVLAYSLFLAFRVGESISFAAAALFAAHPIHTEVVNEAVGRSELLVAVLLLIALHLTLVRRPWTAPAALAAYAAALLCKESAVTFAAILPAVDFFFADDVKAVWRKRLPLYLGMLAVTAVWLAWRTWGVDRGGVPAQLHDPFFTPLALLPAAERILAALRLQILYLAKLVFPWRLQGIYASGDLLGPIGGYDPVWSALTLMALGGAGVLIWFGWRRKHLAALAALLYLFAFAVTSNILFATGVTFAERLAYWPSVWFCLGVTAAGIAVFRGWPPVLWICLFVVTAFLAGRTLVRNQDFQDPVTFWQADVANSPRSALAWKFLGDASFGSGQVDQALRAYGRMAELAPTFMDGQLSYAQALLGAGDIDAAIARAQSIVERDTKAFFPLAHLTLAQAFQRRGQPEEALAHLRKLGRSCRSYDGYWATLGLVLEALGDLEGALRSYRTEEKVFVGERSDLYRRLGDLLLKMNRFAEAEEAYRSDLARHEGAAAWNRLGVSLALQGRADAAVSAFTRAATMRPDAPEYRSNLETARAGLKEP